MFLRALFRDFIILLLSSVIGLFLLTLVFFLPQEKMYENYQHSLPFVESRDGWHALIPGYVSSTLDQNTDLCMLRTSGSLTPDTGENTIQKALRAYRITTENTHGMRFITLEQDGQSLSWDSYERYWHGYTIILKPLMLFFDYMDLTYLNCAFSMVVMAVLLISVHRKTPQLIVAFIFYWVVGMQLNNFFSLVYSVSFYIYAAGVLVLLNYKQDLLQSHVPYIFLMLGILISFFELLCFPLVTMVIPMITFLSLDHSEPKKKTCISLTCICQWCIGYVGMWGAKWIIASALLEDNVIIDAAKQILLRSNLREDAIESTETITLGSAFSRAMQAFANRGVYCILIFFLIMIITVFILRFKKSYGKVNLTSLINTVFSVTPPIFSPV